MFSNLIQVPLQLLDNVDVEGALAAAIRKDFFQPVSAFSKDLSAVQKTHTDTVQGAKNPSDLAQYHHTICQYYHMISDIERKFPDNLVTYDWYDTLGYQPRSHPTSSWRGVKAHLIYQLGALYSHQAHHESRHTDEGTRNACNYFKLSAGCFQFLASQVGHDFEKAVVDTLSWLMLAQAQEVFWQKAMRGKNVKNSLVARLSMKVSETYETALSHGSTSDGIVLEWVNYMKVKHLHFRAAALYRASVQCLDSFEYGQQVGYLKEASKVCAEAKKYKSYVEEGVLEDLAGLTTTVDECLRSAEKDNDLVYLKPVPGARDLPPINGISMVEPQVPDTFSTDSCTIFDALLPFSIIQVGQAFKERQDDYVVQHINEPLAALSRMYTKFLASQNLPSALDTLQRTESLPDTIVDQSREILSIGGIQLIERSMDDISALANNCLQLVSNCEDRLVMEKNEDELMRRQEGTARWCREPSEAASADLMARLAKMRDYLKLGHNSDTLIGQSYQRIRPALEVFCGGKEALLRSIPKSDYLKLNEDLARCVSNLRNLLSEGQDMQSKRERFLTSLEQKFRDRNILSSVISAAKSNLSAYLDGSGKIDTRKFEPIYEKHMKLFEPDLDYVQQSKNQQVKLEAKIVDANASFVASQESSHEQKDDARFVTLQNFHNAYVEYLELVANLNRASTFYSDFLKKGSLVLEEIDEYLYNRRQEARDLGLSIRNQANLESLENSMRQGSNLPAPKGHRAFTWDPSKDVS